MKNVIRLTNPHMDREKMREQACVWLARLDISSTDIDLEELDGWLNESPEHLEVLLEMAELWDQMSMLSELSEVFPLSKYNKRAGFMSWYRAPAIMATCASLVLAFVIGLNLIKGNEELLSTSQITQSVSDTIYETQIGQRSTVELADGSKMILNTDTLVEIIYTDIDRRVYLRRGEGFFTVAKDADRPFRVFAGQRIVEAVGTAFSVQRNNQDNVEVMVTEGKVNFRVFRQNTMMNGGFDENNLDSSLTAAVLQNSEVLPLEAGEYAAAPNEDPSLITTGIIQPEEMEVKLAWQHGMLLFRGDPLEQVLREFGRYTTIKLEATEAVRDIKVEGYYRAGDVERLLVGIEKNLQINVQEINKNHFVLSAK